MNKKTAFLAMVAVLLMGGSMFARLEPRQRRFYQPYLMRGAALGSLTFAALNALAMMARMKRRQARIRKQLAVDRAVAEGDTWLILRPKEAPPVEIEKIRLWQRLAYTQPTHEHFSFEAYGNSEGQGLALHASKNKVRTVLGELFQEWPDMQRRPAGDADPALVPDGWYVYWLEVGPTNTERPVIPSSREPLLGVLSEIAAVPAPTRTLLQVVARLDNTTRDQLGRKSLIMRSSESPSAGMRYQNNQQARLLEERGARAFLQVVIRVAALSPLPTEAQRVATAFANVVCNQFGPDNPVLILAHSSARRPMDLPSRSFTGGVVCSWADDEIASLAHLPGGNALKFAPLLSTSSAKSLPATPDLRIPMQARLARYELQPNG
jgi:hypothetical protein